MSRIKQLHAVLVSLPYEQRDLEHAAEAELRELLAYYGDIGIEALERIQEGNQTP